MQGKAVELSLLLALLTVLLAKTPRAYDYSDIDEDIMPPAPRGEPFQETESDAMKYILDDNDAIEKEIAEGHIGHVLIDGDILNPEVNETSRNKRNVVRERSKLWPGGLVPYVIDSYFHTDSKLAILSAMQRFHDKTCIRFRPRTIERDFVYIGPGRGCWSLVGRQGSRQSMSLGSTCKTKRGTIMHELMHVLGFRHEHNRPDRDAHVIIYWDNIAKPMKDNFKKYSLGAVNLLGVGYDFGSIMHYPMYAFSKNGAATLSPRYTTYQEIGYRNDFSDLDVYRINTLYKCGACQDTDHNHCPTWAMGGSCERNRDWMAKNCAFSCMMCKTNSYGSCSDNHSSCRAWAKVGECRRNPSWMKQTCPLSCGGCPLDLRNRRDEIAGYCHDWSTLCHDWSTLGECTRNPGYMNKRCKYSCQTCKASDKRSHAWTFLGEKGECRDRNPFCPKWAENNMCLYNPSVMRGECKESCNLCPKIPDCHDKHDTKTCKRWAWLGECLTNPEGTKPLCKKSCGWCGEREGCKDLNRRCIRWAREGYCEKSGKFMRKFCAPSCGICTPDPEEDENVLGGEQGARETRPAKKKTKKPARATPEPPTTVTPTTQAPEPVQERRNKKKSKKTNQKKKNKKNTKNKKSKRTKTQTATRQLRPDSQLADSAIRTSARQLPAWKIARLRKRLERAEEQTRAQQEAKEQRLAAKRAESGEVVTGSSNGQGEEVILNEQGGYKEKVNPTVEDLQLETVATTDPQDDDETTDTL